MKLACELGAAAPTAALLAGKIALNPGQTVVAVVSGGNVAPQQAAAILAKR
jgi:threonine dehydratase